eukprot:Clim_evm3s128 gene=Clim_evmTU3s128
MDELKELQRQLRDLQTPGDPGVVKKDTAAQRQARPSQQYAFSDHVAVEIVVSALLNGSIPSLEKLKRKAATVPDTALERLASGEGFITWARLRHDLYSMLGQRRRCTFNEAATTLDVDVSSVKAMIAAELAKPQSDRIIDFLMSGDEIFAAEYLDRVASRINELLYRRGMLSFEDVCRSLVDVPVKIVRAVMESWRIGMLIKGQYNTSNRTLYTESFMQRQEAMVTGSLRGTLMKTPIVDVLVEDPVLGKSLNRKQATDILLSMIRAQPTGNPQLFPSGDLVRHGGGQTVRLDFTPEVYHNKVRDRKLANLKSNGYMAVDDLGDINKDLLPHGRVLGGALYVMDVRLDSFCRNIGDRLERSGAVAVRYALQTDESVLSPAFGTEVIGRVDILEALMIVLRDRRLIKEGILELPGPVLVKDSLVLSLVEPIQASAKSFFEVEMQSHKGKRKAKKGQSPTYVSPNGMLDAGLRKHLTQDLVNAGIDQAVLSAILSQPIDASSQVTGSSRKKSKTAAKRDFTVKEEIENGSMARLLNSILSIRDEILDQTSVVNRIQGLLVAQSWHALLCLSETLALLAMADSLVASLLPKDQKDLRKFQVACGEYMQTVTVPEVNALMHCVASLLYAVPDADAVEKFLSTDLGPLVEPDATPSDENMLRQFGVGLLPQIRQSSLYAQAAEDPEHRRVLRSYVPNDAIAQALETLEIAALSVARNAVDASFSTTSTVVAQATRVEETAQTLMQESYAQSFAGWKRHYAEVRGLESTVDSAGDIAVHGQLLMGQWLTNFATASRAAAGYSVQDATYCLHLGICMAFYQCSQPQLVHIGGGKALSAALKALKVIKSDATSVEDDVLVGLQQLQTFIKDAIKSGQGEVRDTGLQPLLKHLFRVYEQRHVSSASWSP